MDIFINLLGIALIAAIIWWFWLAKPVARRVQGVQPVEIVVADGTYTPARIEVQTGKSVTLRFVRKDPSPCAEKVILNELGKSDDLKVNQPVDVRITLAKRG
ncbi:MAG: cupredoxin domain-containing protein, partial [Pseudomonadota bacterium]